MRCWWTRGTVTAVVLASVVTVAMDTNAGVFTWGRERREAELQSTVAQRVRFELSSRMTKVSNDLAEMLGLQVSEEAAKLEAQVAEATEQLAQQHDEDLAAMQEAFAAEAEALRQQVDSQLANAQQRLARQTARSTRETGRQLRAVVEDRTEVLEERLEEQATEELARMAVAGEVRIERSLDRATELLERRVERAVREEMAAATKTLEQQVEPRLAALESERTQRDRAGVSRGQGRKQPRESRVEEPKPATTRIVLPVAPEPPLESAPLAPMPIAWNSDDSSVR
jgi:hypothetical protein